MSGCWCPVPHVLHHPSEQWPDVGFMNHGFGAGALHVLFVLCCNLYVAVAQGEAVEQSGGVQCLSAPCTKLTTAAGSYRHLSWPPAAQALATGVVTLRLSGVALGWS